MKTITKTILGLMFIAALIVPAIIKAQPNCPFVVTNNLGCPIKIDIEFYEYNPPPTCISCAGAVNYSIPAGQSITFTCAQMNTICSTGNYCNVFATLTSPVASSTADLINNPMISVPGLHADCNGNGTGSINIHPNGVDINP